MRRLFSENIRDEFELSFRIGVTLLYYGVTNSVLRSIAKLDCLLFEQVKRLDYTITFRVL